MMKLERAHPNITISAGKYIRDLFSEKLPCNLSFHNLNHTINVVQGVRKIGANLNLDPDQQQILTLAAWFHDSGHTVCYNGHEKESQKLATTFLDRHAYPEVKSKLVLSCIRATQMPQQPRTILEEIMCDADLFHLSLKEYPLLQYQLRQEWVNALGKAYSDERWMEENLLFLQKHQFFTTYGKEKLEKRKFENILRFKLFMEYSNTK